MKELFYFTFADLMVQAEYAQESNSLKYASHRDMNFGERIAIEQYLLSNFALKTEYYKRQPAVFIFLGVDKRLIRELNLFHLKNTLNSIVSREKEVDEKVKMLINDSLQNYYFEQIGDTILALRKEVNGNCRSEVIVENQSKMAELLKAYNLYAGKNISLAEVIPDELKAFMEN
ncbi:hypothetical protein JW964_24870 [candidate division KSB1 bacterium]|nr:hypothetical protein [candidate division KSB1 bacterium]